MKTPLTLALVTVGVIALQSCGKSGYEQELMAGYALQSQTSEENAALVFQDGADTIDLVAAPVIAYIDNAEYIAVIRDAKASSSDSEPEGEQWEYFVIPLKSPIAEDASGNLIGPMNRQDFVDLLNERKLRTSIHFAFLDA